MLPATMSAIRAKASSVEPATWGRVMTRSLAYSGSAGFHGSWIPF